MSYLHCHICDWSQDDFWSFKISKKGYWKWFGYNPISLFCSYFCWYIIPKRIKFDSDWARENNCRIDPFSWYLLFLEFKRMFRKFKNQKYWTYNSFKKAGGLRKCKCPKCGNINLDID